MEIFTDRGGKASGKSTGTAVDPAVTEDHRRSKQMIKRAKPVYVG
jgi:hypothetical protein